VANAKCVAVDFFFRKSRLPESNRWTSGIEPDNATTVELEAGKRHINVENDDRHFCVTIAVPCDESGTVSEADTRRYRDEAKQLFKTTHPAAEIG
jgi:hypothetical protein